MIFDDFAAILDNFAAILDDFEAIFDDFAAIFDDFVSVFDDSAYTMIIQRLYNDLRRISTILRRLCIDYVHTSTYYVR